ncbi:hypothetical protein [Frankia sp. AgKG'84/4]|uniref:hypothetical protein n=1 Tax=Frankia sp. AgKG'84/4 TaxID=573490 RepID=UPI00200E5C12|nr:hypothetical protein [Frankia sp. AgKG'84/4]MCL9795211.1 hypothetical protein [Frankia sp. AgKG'84/4]
MAEYEQPVGRDLASHRVVVFRERAHHRFPVGELVFEGPVPPHLIHHRDGVRVPHPGEDRDQSFSSDGEAQQ